MGEQIANALTEIGFRLHPSGFATALFERYPVIATVKRLNKSIQIQFRISTDATTPGAARRELKKLLRTILKSSATVSSTGESLSILAFVKALNDTPEMLNNALLETVRTLEANGIAPRQACAICKQETCDSLALYKDCFAPVHRSCIKGAIENDAKEINRNLQSGSYFTGIIGALLGVIVGIIPNLLSIWFLHYVIAYLFALIPICGYYGYKMLGGKMNISALVITLVLSVAGVYFMQILRLVMEVMKEYYTTFIWAFGASFKYVFSDIGVLLDLTRDSLLEFLFLGLGIFIAWRTIRRTNADDEFRVKTMEDTIVPYPEDADLRSL